MTQQVINVGAAPNDGTGDPARTAFTKTNSNFTDLYAGNGNFLQSGTGAVSRTVQSKERDIVSVKDFGAVGDGSADIASALQAAHDAMPSSGGTIIIPAATTYWLMNSGVIFTKPIKLQGVGWTASEIYSTTASQTLIRSTAKLDIEDIYFAIYGAARTTSVVVQQDAASAGHGYGTMRNVRFDGGNICYRNLGSNQFVLDSCYFGAQGAYGIFLENTSALPSSSDIGDSFITNCTFAGVSTSVSIFVGSTSGLYVTGCKFNTGVLGHVNIAPGAYSVGDFTFQGCSFEGQVSYGIRLVGTTGVITKTLITGNQFSSGTAGVSLNHVIVGQGAWNTTITGNTFNSTDSTQTLHSGVNVQTGSKDTTITGNEFYQIYNAVICNASATLGITMSGNRFAFDVTQVFQGDDGANVLQLGSNREIGVTRYFQEAAAALTSAWRFKGAAGTLEIMIYGTAQGSGNVNYSRKVAIYNDTTVNDINAAVAQGSAITVALTNVAGFLDLQVAKSAGTSFTGYVEVIARGQISYVKRM